jgi:hypothetical protein
MTITNPKPNRCPEIGDTYNLEDVCPKHDIHAMFNLLDELIDAVNNLPSWLHKNIEDEIGFVVQTFCVPYYIEMGKFFNLPKGTTFSTSNDAPFSCHISRLDRTITIEDISDDFDTPSTSVNLNELLSSANIDGRTN